MQPIILVIHLILAVALVAVILMQRSEGGAANLTGGGGGAGGMGGFMSARGASNFLTKLTAYLATAFIATSLLLAVFAGTEVGPASIMDDAAPLVPAEAPVADEPVEPVTPSVPLSE